MQHLNSSSKVVSKIIAKVEARNCSLSQQCLGNPFARVISQIFVFALANPSEIFGSYFAMLFYLFNQYKTIIKCLVKAVNSSTYFRNILWVVIGYLNIWVSSKSIHTYIHTHSYIHIYIHTYYQFESHLTICWVNKK